MGGAKARSKSSAGRDLTHELLIDFMTAVRGGTESIRVSRGGTGQTVEVKIPRGTRHGAKLTLRGMGAPSPSGGSAGDLILDIRVGTHPLFRRAGEEQRDIELDLPLTIAEATLGTTVSVPTPEGKVELKVPPGTSSGQRLRLRGFGVKRDDGAAGDLFAVVKVVTPRKVTETERAMLEDLGRRMESPRSGPEWR
ncbi:MAG: hypothetical protein IBJ11_04985 [Phycisphaerales bacterium]|nr:hypothetical protein [Phycisphaerales bacterium]